VGVWVSSPNHDWRVFDEVMIMSESSLPPEFKVLSRLVDAQEPNVRELYQYALALLMVEDGKAEITEQRTVSMREHLTLRTVAGDTFTIVKPDIRAELLAQMQEMVREVLDEERGRADGAGG
jgi:hypothetical protein